MSDTHSLPMPYTGRTHWWKMRYEEYEEQMESYFSISVCTDVGYLVGDIVYMQYTVDGGYAGGMYRQIVNVESCGITARDELVRLTLAPVGERDVRAAGAAWEVNNGR